MTQRPPCPPIQGCFRTVTPPWPTPDLGDQYRSATSTRWDGDMGPVGARHPFGRHRPAEPVRAERGPKLTQCVTTLISTCTPSTAGPVAGTVTCGTWRGG